MEYTPPGGGIPIFQVSFPDGKTIPVHQVLPLVYDVQ